MGASYPTVGISLRNTHHSPSESQHRIRVWRHQHAWCSIGTRTEQTPEEAAPARPPQEETEETREEQEENIRDSYPASHALAQVPATQGEQLSVWTFSPSFHNNLFFHSAAEQSLPFLLCALGIFPRPAFPPLEIQSLESRNTVKSLEKDKKPQHPTIRWVQSL